ncbi:TonB-dependent receptor plug domain-containing protein [Saccharicrinis fermentans]|uniref:Colicin I receptor n=1 Tax=Saccharicrinis fermentans DSM 9555 = JCM 21142 TaxID=869213 RepID=W7Y475_9BACT|nr:Plug domain-containing protein [Saccharicrinis fermentans]GAF02373.1 colicin I receptor precursor [Saccharicrinis fermentans DSM 9555 = JCM 21142]
MNKYILLFIAVFTAQCVVYAQDHSQTVNIEELTLEQMRGMTQEDLLQLPFEDLIQLVKELKLSSIEELYNLILNPTQSTASKMEEDIFNAPLATTVITADELSKSGVRSIPEALKLAPGIIVREKTNGNYDVHIRGNDYISPGSDFENTVNSTTLVMIDNRPVYNNFLGATFWENLPISVNDVSKIEIIYGPSAALYGPNAVSGVIHFITKKNKQEGIHTDFDIQEGSSIQPSHLHLWSMEKVTGEFVYPVIIRKWIAFKILITFLKSRNILVGMK